MSVGRRYLDVDRVVLLHSTPTHLDGNLGRGVLGLLGENLDLVDVVVDLLQPLKGLVQFLDRG